MHSDEALHARLIAGQMSAFDALYERHARPLHGFIRRHLADAHEAEDVLHETFMALLRERDPARAPSCVRAWMFQTARNLCLNRLRSRRRGERAIEAVGRETVAHDSPAAELESMQTHERLRRAVEALPPGLAELYSLRASGLSHEELARVLSIPVGTVKSRIHDMVSRLREEMNR